MRSNSHVMLAAMFGCLVATAPAQVRWRQLCPPQHPAPQLSHAMAYDSDRGVVVLYDTLGQTWEGNGVKWQLIATSQNPGSRYDHAMAYDGNRHVVVLFGGAGITYPDDTWEYDGLTWTLRPPLVSPPGRTGHALV